jgi:hypothetical protein
MTEGLQALLGWLQKALEEANIFKLASVISDIMGVSGRRMIEA